MTLKKILSLFGMLSAILGVIVMIGSVGGSDHGTMEFSKAIIGAVVGFVTMVLGGLVYYLFN